MTWHEVAYSGPYGRRFGSRSMLHGHFSFDGSTLTMTTTVISALRWRSKVGQKERRHLSHLAQTISPVDQLDLEMLVLGKYQRVNGEVSVPVGSVATYHRAKRTHF